jgi:hypothetical protein
VEQSKNERGDFRVRLVSEPAFEGSKIVERLIYNGKPDDRINQVRVDGNIEIHSGNERDNVSESKKRHVNRDVLQFVQKKDDPEQKKQMVVSGDHVLRSQIYERDDLRSGRLLNVPLITKGYTVRKRLLKK